MINPLAMKKHPTPRRRIELGFIAALALVLAAFEWTAFEYDTVQHSAYTGGLALEAEVVPPNAPSKPAPPVRNLLITPEIHLDPPVGPEPSPDPDPTIDPLAGKIQGFDFGDFGDGDDSDWKVETVLVAEHMPHFSECSNVLNRDEERACTEGQMIRMIQACAKFPPILREAGIGGVVYLQFNVNEFGAIQDETVLKSAHPKLDNAALDALKCIPRLEPGTQQGRPVRVTYTIPVRFTIR